MFALPKTEFSIQKALLSLTNSPAGNEENMKLKYAWLAALTLIVCFLGLTSRGQEQTSATTSWEYASVFSTSSSTGFVLNDLGAKGWELVAVDVTANDKNGFKGTTYYLKRRK
jgi:hypothetical protein